MEKQDCKLPLNGVVGLLTHYPKETLIKFKRNKSRFLDFAELPEERAILLRSE
jgi:hypothetical protein